MGLLFREHPKAQTEGGCFVRCVQLCNEKYTGVLTKSPVRSMLTNMNVISMNSFSRDFTLLLLAMKQAAISKKNWRTNK